MQGVISYSRGAGASRRHSLLKYLSGSVSLVAVMCGQAGVTQAQEKAANASGFEEVIVTARRVEESIQTVPVSVQAISPEQMKIADIRGANQLESTFAGITLSVQGSSGFSRIVARGVQGVATYFNGAPTFAAGNAIFFDLASIQGLTGPQGTLFGIATNGGAIVLEPNKPTDKFEGFVEGTAGNYNRLGADAVVNIPLSDRFQIRVGGEINRRDGYVLDITSGARHGTDNYQYGRISARYVSPDDKFENILLAQYAYSYGLKEPLVPFLINPTGPSAVRLGAAWVSRVAANIAMGPYKFRGPLTTLPPNYEGKALNIVNTTTFALNDHLTLKNIFSHVAVEELFAEGDVFGSLYTGYPEFGSGIPFGRGLRADGTQAVPFQPQGFSRATNEEFQVLGTFDKLKFVVGTFNSWTGNPNPEPVQCIASFGALSCANNIRGTQPTSQAGLVGEGETHAGYGQGTYDLSDFVEGLNFTAGIRYTYDKIAYPGQITLNPTTLQVIAASSGSQGPVSFGKVSYHLNLDYQFNPNTMVYVSNSKGYSKGGFNGLSAPAQLQVYGPETLNMYEVGMKSDFHTGSWLWRADVALYYGKFNNVQVLSQTLLNGTLTQSTANAARARTQGFETNITVKPDESFEITSAVGYNEINYTQYLFQTSVNPPTFQDRKKQKFIVAPRWKTNTTIVYHLPMDKLSEKDIGSISVAGAWNFRSTICNGAQLVPAQTIANGLCFGPRHHVDASLTWDDVMGRHGLQGSFQVTNVTNNKYGNGNGPTYYSLGYSSIALEPPRMFYFRVKQAF